MKFLHLEFLYLISEARPVHEYDRTRAEALEQVEKVPAGERWSTREGDSLAGKLLGEGNGE